MTALYPKAPLSLFEESPLVQESPAQVPTEGLWKLSQIEIVRFNFFIEKPVCISRFLPTT